MAPPPVTEQTPLPADLPRSGGQRVFNEGVDALLGALGVKDALGAETPTAGTAVGQLASILSPLAMMGGLKRIKNPIRAFHGSPHDFDQFKMSQIGTGEGAQAYGHGLYFAESPEVALAYQKALTQRHLDTPEYWDSVQGQVPSFLTRQEQDELFNLQQKLRQNAQGPGNPPLTSSESVRFRALKDKYDSYYAGVEALKPKGRMYEVNIHASPETLLDWDAPLSQQPVAVQRTPPMQRLLQEEAAYKQRYPSGGLGEREGSNVLTTVKEAELQQSGIPGLRYLDGLSRRAGEGTRNYVIWDEDVIEILRKYGIVPPLAAAATGLRPEPSHPPKR